ncbi:uncharacterized protein DSM5745_02421 [Aspergillus mulundensis]|uniref:FAD-binding FR-type domain-containing protein n=1 Tax=Aspergillus mulundensis TaxID=1810919 RepID=A0A3D8SWH3_9EURO|nr:hypothetical protein DSM5745_02421 [Aspergillus mulundensis]RDW90646.1 hypothetical protein DSM5745_02421 [Aspergillus mulundensis]
MATALQGWHPGETKLHNLLHFPDSIAASYVVIESQLREQHRIFHTSNLPFIPLTVIDEDGRPWAGIAAGSGEIGFVTSPDLKTLVFGLHVWDGDPLAELLDGWSGKAEERALTAGLGIEFSTRRRNKFAGSVRGVRAVAKEEYVVRVEVNEAVGNCPKYINTRHLIPHPNANPTIAHRVQSMPPDSQLPTEVINMITSADTVFIASIYKADPATARTYPSHAGMNARGGLPGFIRVLPSDGHTVVLPDYSGNRFLSSLGNIEASGVAGFTIVDFETGDVLYLTGNAKNLVGEEVGKVMKRHAGTVTVLEVTGYTLVKDALPVRQAPGSEVGRSPYSPKVKYLVEEDEQGGAGDAAHKARLESARQLSHDLAVFRFKVESKQHEAKTLSIRPGQAIVLDFMDWLGPPTYRHMADTAPGSINDDRVRTWTVSSAHEDNNVAWFELTMREMKGGAVTGALFNILRRHPRTLRHQIHIADSVVADIVGVTGDFVLSNDELDVLWVAGGIGITPFLAMLDALVSRENASGDIIFALSTREPDILLELLRKILTDFPKRVPKLTITLDLFTRAPVGTDIRAAAYNTDNIRVRIHEGRIIPEYWETVPNITGKDVFICGPNGFGNVVVDGLRAVGVSNERIQREGFY